MRGATWLWEAEREVAAEGTGANTFAESVLPQADTGLTKGVDFPSVDCATGFGSAALASSDAAGDVASAVELEAEHGGTLTTEGLLTGLGLLLVDGPDTAGAATGELAGTVPLEGELPLADGASGMSAGGVACDGSGDAGALGCGSAAAFTAPLL